jgi:hypothetical protein
VFAELGATVAAVNSHMHELLHAPGGTRGALRYTIGRHAFDDEDRVDRYLAHFGARRLVHGHTPHSHATPRVSHDGRVLAFDGRFSRYWSPEGGEPTGPVGATIALLPE